MEQKIKTLRKSSIVKRKEIEMYYRSKYFSLFMNGYEFDGLDYQQQRFLLSQLWEKGTIACFILEGSKPISLLIDDNKQDENQGELILTPYSTSKFNIYNFPEMVQLVKLRGVNFIPTTPQRVNQDVVIGWGHSSHMPIRSIVDFYVDKITEVEITARMNLETHKLPRLVVCSPEDKKRVEELMNKIQDGVPRLFLEVDDIKAIQNVLQSGGEFIVDKLFTYKQNLERELMTILGIDNIGTLKRERQNNDEVNANNEEIDNGGDCFVDEMNIFCKQVSDVLGYKISVREKKPRVEMLDTTEEDTTTDNNGEGEEQ